MNLLYAFASFCIAGLGQLLQRRFEWAALFFLAAVAVHVASFSFCAIGGGFIVHVIAAVEAYRWKG